MRKMAHAQISLDPEIFNFLAKIARREGTSVSEIIRTVVKEQFTERQELFVRIVKFLIRRPLSSEPRIGRREQFSSV